MLDEILLESVIYSNCIELEKKNVVFMNEKLKVKYNL